MKIATKHIISLKLKSTLKPIYFLQKHFLNQGVRTYSFSTNKSLYINCPQFRKMQFQNTYSMAKVVKKQEAKKKQKQKIKQSLGGDVSEVDLGKFQQPYLEIVQKFKLFLSKCRVGKIDSQSFDDVHVKIGKESFQLSHLAQIAPKNSVTCIISPFDSDNIQAIQKAIKASDSSLQINKVQKSLSVTLPNSSIKQLKQKMMEKVKKSLNDQRQLLKKQRHKNQQEIKKYKKVAQEDKLRQIEKQMKQIFDKSNDKLQTMAKQKQKQLMK